MLSQKGRASSHFGASQSEADDGTFFCGMFPSPLHLRWGSPYRALSSASHAPLDRSDTLPAAPLSNTWERAPCGSALRHPSISGAQIRRHGFRIRCRSPTDPPARTRAPAQRPAPRRALASRSRRPPPRFSLQARLMAGGVDSAHGPRWSRTQRL